MSLCYNPTANTITVNIIKARHLKAMDIGGTSGREPSFFVCPDLFFFFFLHTTCVDLSEVLQTTLGFWTLHSQLGHLNLSSPFFALLAVTVWLLSPTVDNFSSKVTLHQVSSLASLSRSISSCLSFRIFSLPAKSVTLIWESVSVLYSREISISYRTISKDATRNPCHISTELYVCVLEQRSPSFFAPQTGL